MDSLDLPREGYVLVNPQPVRKRELVLDPCIYTNGFHWNFTFYRFLKCRYVEEVVAIPLLQRRMSKLRSLRNLIEPSDPQRLFDALNQDIVSTNPMRPAILVERNRPEVTLELESPDFMAVHLELSQSSD